MDKLKKFFEKKTNIIMVIGILVVVVIVVLVAILFKREDKEKFSLSKIYDVYPEDVRNLYANMVSVSCYGDLYLDLKLDSGKIKVADINRNNLIDYMFSYMDKHDKFEDEMEVNDFNAISSDLFNEKLDFKNDIDKYKYGEYEYLVEDGKVKRNKAECSSDKKYVSHLYGYSHSDLELSIDVNIGYEKDGKLYDLADNLLGDYDGDVSKLGDLFGNNSFYRYNYVLDGKIFKLDSVEWNSRS